MKPYSPIASRISKKQETDNEPVNTLYKDFYDTLNKIIIMLFVALRLLYYNNDSSIMSCRLSPRHHLIHL